MPHFYTVFCLNPIPCLWLGGLSSFSCRIHQRDQAVPDESRVLQIRTCGSQSHQLCKDEICAKQWFLMLRKQTQFGSLSKMLDTISLSWFVSVQSSYLVGYLKLSAMSFNLKRRCEMTLNYILWSLFYRCNVTPQVFFCQEIVVLELFRLLGFCFVLFPS